MQHEPQVVIDLLELSRMQDPDDIFHMMEDFSSEGCGASAPNPWDELGESDFVGHRKCSSLLDELKSIFSAPAEEPNQESPPMGYDI